MQVIKREAATVAGFLTPLCVVSLGPLIKPENAGWALSGVVHLALFGAYVMLIFDNSV